MTSKPLTAAGRALRQKMCWLLHAFSVSDHNVDCEVVLQGILAIEAEAIDIGLLQSFDDVQRMDRAEAAAPVLDVERLAEAGGNVLDGRRIGSVRLYPNTITPDDWQAIATEYDRLASAEPAPPRR